MSPEPVAREHRRSTRVALKVIIDAPVVDFHHGLLWPTCE